MKTFDIHSESQFEDVVKVFTDYFVQRKRDKKKFQSFTLISKRYRKSRTPEQLRKYWACIHDLKKAFKEKGNDWSEDIIHSFIKREAGFTKMIELPNGKMIMVEKSISNESEDVNIENASFLISFIIQWAQENLNVVIKSGYESGHQMEIT